ncbi:Fps/Fes/Fer/CIP4 homology [Penicillium griseofulvum]|uniref:Fps/Fes/Fer/CIP4 homology n=1 Tax=Penicillium patulum TaxID=5078 RepID=A0A135LKF5_PENPA|nr:Fps/Fes/Fer/CIP4 homology [Penicillium griseofulvum]KXG49398.1 Fps/Fes/Fer/CIP4 homology [Penicillium griseofulvum]
MDLSRQEYPTLLATLHPGQATTVLSDRIKLINKINVDIADYLQERRRVEEAYAQGLRKLAHRPQLDNGAALGIFQIPWQRIISATETLAVSHETLANKIEEDVERPLREFSSKNSEMKSMPGIQSNLAGLAKNVEAAQKKVDKARAKGAKGAEKLASEIANAEEVHQQWDSRAPFVYEQLQAADETRLNHLRDVLTQLETHEVDQVERGRQAAESCLNVLLNVETADEIKTFAARMAGPRVPVTQAVPRRQTERAETPSTLELGPDRTPTAPVEDQFSTPRSEAPLPPPPRIQDDAASQLSEASERQHAIAETSPAPEAQPRHTPLGGLRRLGTVMNRRKSVALPSTGSFDRKAEKKRSPFAAFKRADSSRDLQIPESPPATASDRPGTSFTDQSSLRNPSVSHDRTGLDTVATIPEAHPETIRNGVAPESLELTNNHANQPQVDSEGYTQRPGTVDEITRAQNEAAGLDESGMNLTIRDQPIFEDESQAKQAMDNMANTLRMRAPQTGMRRNAGTIRGRRDVRNTVFIASPGNELPLSTTKPESQQPTSPIRNITSPSIAPSVGTDDHTMSDTTSVRSGHTMHGPGPSVHPDLYGSGLNASVIETISAWFSEGIVTKSFAVGELALAYNPTPGMADYTRIRLDNFQVLEKVAANPHFVQEVAKDAGDDKRGEYDIQLGSISRSMPTVAFKYQLHIDPANPSAYCPVIFKPVWNLEELQASAIIYYTLNPSFISNVAESITLKNLVLTINLDTAAEDKNTGQPRESVAHAASAAMYPNTGAVFRRKTSTVTWRIPDLEVKAPTTPGAEGKFLVRFVTSTSGPRKGIVEAKFELRNAESASPLGISRAASEAEQMEADPFADEGRTSQPFVPWLGVPTTRKLISGKYVSS